MAAARSARFRLVQSLGHPRTDPNTFPVSIAVTQRVSARHRSSPSPQPPTCRRTRPALSPCPYRKSESPIALAPKCLRATTPRGTTTTTALQLRQRYRRTRIVAVRCGPPGSAGPRTCRSRSPCPTSVTGPPKGRLAAPQHGQRPGRHASTLGGPCSQILTSTAECTTTPWLRFFFTCRSERDEGSALPIDAPHLLSLRLATCHRSGSPPLP